MAASILLSPLSASTTPELVGSSPGLVPKSGFPANSSSLLLLTNPRTRQRRPLGGRYTISASSSKSRSRIPKRFREENLDPALMENYKNAHRHLFGLPPSQLEMFMTENNPFGRKAGSASKENLSSKHYYTKGMISLSGMNTAQSSLSSTMYRKGGERGRPRTAPPDLPSLILDARIVFLGMPIVPPVAELLVAQFLFLDYDDTSKPIYLYINCPGTQNEMKQVVGSETDAYAIADAMAFCKSRIYTLNLCMAFGQAATLLSLGTPGCRVVLPYSYTKLYMPKSVRSSGNASDMWSLAKDIYANADSYLDLLAQGTGKDKEKLAKDLQRPKFFGAQQTIDYGLADRIIEPNEILAVKRDYAAMRAQAKATRAAAARARAASTGFRQS